MALRLSSIPTNSTEILNLHEDLLRKHNDSNVSGSCSIRFIVRGFPEAKIPSQGVSLVLLSHVIKLDVKLPTPGDYYLR